MPQSLAAVTFLVRDYDEAIAFFTAKLGFAVIEDSPLGGGKRWVVVAPSGPPGGTRLLLAQPKNAAEAAAVGNQTGGRVFLFLHTDDFRRDHAAFRTRGVEFLEEPREESYGTVAVFRDLYDGKWDLIEPRAPDAAGDSPHSRKTSS